MTLNESEGSRTLGMERLNNCFDRPFICIQGLERLDSENGQLMNCGVYIMTNASHRTLYVGMSTDLPSRVESHRQMSIPGFTQRYRCTKLVYYEGCSDQDQAYLREKQLKGWTRVKKVGLINQFNSTWKDKFEDLITEST
ncbi:MAG: putative endonuclease [Patescibacteria group bacterium]|jgi:putative endonuclease|nr:putative endonuclease [Patescibacteria group bacterium]